MIYEFHASNTTMADHVVFYLKFLNFNSPKVFQYGFLHKRRKASNDMNDSWTKVEPVVFTATEMCLPAGKFPRQNESISINRSHTRKNSSKMATYHNLPRLFIHSSIHSLWFAYMSYDDIFRIIDSQFQSVWKDKNPATNARVRTFRSVLFLSLG